jgi:hypothetical protein
MFSGSLMVFVGGIVLFPLGNDFFRFVPFQSSICFSFFLAPR